MRDVVGVSGEDKEMEKKIEKEKRIGIKKKKRIKK